LQVIVGLAMGIGALSAIGWALGFVHVGRMGRVEAFYESVLDSLHDACVVADERGRVIVSNHAYRKLLSAAGISRTVGVESLYTGYPDISDRIYRLTLAARDGQSAYEEFRLQT